ncbi:hypothetical protein ACFQ3Z_00500 [Streptomyces nogalater]
MMCLTADPGVGKTFTLHLLCEQRPALHALRLLPRPQARPDDLRHSLHRALNLPGHPPQDAASATTTYATRWQSRPASSPLTKPTNFPPPASNTCATSTTIPSRKSLSCSSPAGPA